MKEEMTVHEALCELKLAGKKIAKAINAVFCETRKESTTKINGIEIPEFEEGIKQNYQRALDLIRRTEAMKRAISLSNAATVISVAGKEMTVAEAIYEFQHGAETKEALIEELRRQYNACTKRVALENGEALEQKRERYINQLFSNREAVKISDIRAAEDDFTKKNTFSMVDPLHLENVINELQEQVDEFKSKFDAVLQMSNATTKIVIEY